MARWDDASVSTQQSKEAKEAKEATQVQQQQQQAKQQQQGKLYQWLQSMLINTEHIQKQNIHQISQVFPAKNPKKKSKKNLSLNMYLNPKIFNANHVQFILYSLEHIQVEMKSLNFIVENLSLQTCLIKPRKHLFQLLQQIHPKQNISIVIYFHLDMKQFYNEQIQHEMIEQVKLLIRKELHVDNILSSTKVLYIDVVCVTIQNDVKDDISHKYRIPYDQLILKKSIF